MKIRYTLLVSICIITISACAKDVKGNTPPPIDESIYNNPVVNYSLPDPTVIKGDDGYFYLYATEDIRNLPIHRSKDLVNWKLLGTAFTDATRPSFEPKGGIWA
ncbi:MAG: family 43 glycosylhydrolase, partial [Muribaculaceae bacterium]